LARFVQENHTSNGNQQINDGPQQNCWGQYMARATSQKIRSPASQFSLGVSRSSGRVGNATANAAIVTAVAVGALYFGKPVFIPFAIAVLVAFVLSPVVTIYVGFVSHASSPCRLSSRPTSRFCCPLEW